MLYVCCVGELCVFRKTWARKRGVGERRRTWKIGREGREDEDFVLCVEIVVCLCFEM
jgi:hypothetical protein